MSEDIKELVKRLRHYYRDLTSHGAEGDLVGDDVILSAADALEVLTEERDRLKAALEAKQTDPAPAVCEWTRTPYTALYSSCCDEDYLRNVTDSGMCNRCGKPIKFTEAKE